jgi:hypothetical protein
MSDALRLILCLASIFGGLAGLAWVGTLGAGLRFWPTMFVELGIYAAILFAYACYRRLVVRRRRRD